MFWFLIHKLDGLTKNSAWYAMLISTLDQRVFQFRFTAVTEICKEAPVFIGSNIIEDSFYATRCLHEFDFAACGVRKNDPRIDTRLTRGVRPKGVVDANHIFSKLANCFCDLLIKLLPMTIPVETIAMPSLSRSSLHCQQSGHQLDP